MRLLLVNPPAPRPVLRDYYCGTTSKGGYYWPPIDLIAQSGHLSALGEVGLVEAAARNMSPEAAMEKIAAFKPDLLLSLMATPSLTGDMAFLERAKSAMGARLVVTGEPALVWDATWWERFSFVDAVLGDFTSAGLADWLKGEDAPDALSLPGQGPPRVRRTSLVRFPMPKHHLFLQEPYRHPFLGRGRLGTLLMAFGCPYRCAYCNSGFDSLGFGRRSVDEVLAESESLKEAGAKRLYVKDMSFGADAHQADQVLRGWIRRRLRLPWAAYVRLDLLQEGLLERMAEAGCVGIQVGLEAVDVAKLPLAGRNQNQEMMEARLKRARTLGMKAGGHFVLGLPGQSQESIEATLVWARSLPLSYASFNVFTPRFGTPLERQPDYADLRHRPAGRDSSRGGVGESAAALALQQRAARAFYGRPRAALNAAGLWLRQAGWLP